MDHHSTSARKGNLTSLAAQDDILKSHVKAECEQIDISETELCNLDNAIKSELLSIDDYEELDLQETNERPPLEFATKCDGINFTEQKYFSCPSCKYKTTYKYNLIRHAKIHEKSPKLKIYKCEQCPFESTQKAYLERHYKVHYSDTYYKCTKCDFTTKYQGSICKHELIHKPPSECKMFTCNQCGFTTKQKLSLQRHMLTHKRLEEVEHFKCTYCKFVTKHQISMNNHILKIHKKDKIEKHKCPECDFSTYHKISLKGHRLTHRKPGEVPMHKCPECSYETKNKAFLSNHMKCHKETVPCPKCNKLITQRGMPLHLKSHESGDAKNRYKCKECPYATLYFGNMSRHMKIMHSNKEEIDYKMCPECPFKTFENARLKRHIKEIHSLEAPQYKCGECEFTSKFNSCLKRHVETAHGDKKPEMCPVCFKQSANIYTLRIHMKIHRNEDEIKMFQCGECSYKTRHSGAFKDHIIRHKPPDEVPMYQCTNCSYQSKIKSCLEDHIRRSSDSSNNTVCCPSCCFRTSTANNLRIHMSKVHRDEMDQSEFLHCALCGFKTLNKRVLKDHMKEHKNGNIFEPGEYSSSMPLAARSETYIEQENNTQIRENLVEENTSLEELSVENTIS